MSPALNCTLYCPEWCELDDAGHELHGDDIDGSVVHIRSVKRDCALGGYWDVTIEQANDSEGTMRGQVGITAGISGTPMRPTEARAMAHALLDAADRAEGSHAYLRRGIGASVAACMVDHGLTPARLAELIGMSEGNLWRRLSGASGFSAEDMVRLARALDVEVGELMM